MYELVKVNRFFAFLLIFLFEICIFTSAVAKNASIYGALPDVKEIEISPDGSTLAMLQTINGTQALVFFDLENSANAPKGAAIPGSNPRTIRWANNDHVLVLISQSHNVGASTGLTTLEFFRWVAISKKTQKATPLMGNEPGYFMSSAGAIASMLPDDPDNILIARSSTKANLGNTPSSSRLKKKDAKWGYSLHRVSLKNGKSKIVAAGQPDTVDWVVDNKGKPILRIDYDTRTAKRNIYRSTNGKKFELIKTIQEEKGYGSEIIFYSQGRNEDLLLAESYVGRDKSSLVEFSLSQAKIVNTVFQDDNYDLSRIAYDPMTASVGHVEYIDDMPQSYHLDETYRTIQKQLEGALPGATPRITSKSADGRKLIVEATYSDHPKQFFLFDRDKKALDMVAASYNALDGKVHAAKEKFDYVSSDNMYIPGYLTVPARASKVNMPLIVLPHGGPESRSDKSFRYWSFFYAANGYLVYEPNFRGSHGYGDRFLTAGHGEWGRKMQQDITEGVNKLIQDGIADPDRICIVGASYGGYAALAGATLTPDLYSCAVSVNGVSNLAGMLGTKPTGSMAKDFWTVRIGQHIRDLSQINAVSPNKLAKYVKAPILLIHGKDDVVVPVGQSRQMRDALEAAGKEHDYVELDGEDHWLSEGKSRTEMLSRSLDFINAHIGDR